MLTEIYVGMMSLALLEKLPHPEDTRIRVRLASLGEKKIPFTKSYNTSKFKIVSLVVISLNYTLT